MARDGRSHKKGSSLGQSILDHVLTLSMTAELLYFVYLFRANFTEVGASFAIVCLAIPIIKSVFGVICLAIGSKKNLAKEVNKRKFVDQSVQLVSHLFTFSVEYWILSHETWWTEPKTMFELDKPPASDLSRRLYIFQIAHYLVLGYSHRFWEERRKDYFVMFTHHVITIALLLGSWWLGCERIGIVILAIHDVSDVPGDLLKMSNYLGLDWDNGFPLTELLFLGVMISWAYTRLYLFPTQAIYAGFWYTTPNACPPEGFGAFTGSPSPLCWTLRGFLLLLQGMHIYWYSLFLKIAYSLLKGTKAHEAGRESYEGDSDEDHEDHKKEDKKKKK